MAILLAGLLGSAAEAVRDNPPIASALGLPAGRLIIAVSGIGLVGTTVEATAAAFSWPAQIRSPICTATGENARLRLAIGRRSSTTYEQLHDCLNGLWNNPEIRQSGQG